MPYSTDHSLHPTAQPFQRGWVYLGGMLLSAIAGYVNVILLEFFYVPVSHMSGAVSRLSLDLGQGQVGDFKLIFGIFLGFLLGATLSGLLIGQVRLKPGRRYGLILALEGLLLVLVAQLMSRGLRMAVPMAAFACGLQNAMASSYYGLVLRTTHVTGIVTDLGVLLGQWIRYRKLPFWKLQLLGSLLGGFFLGGFAASRLYPLGGAPSLYLAALSCGGGGLAYSLYVHRLKARGEI